MTVAESRMPDLVEMAEMEAAAEKLQAAIDAATALLRDAEDARDKAEHKVRCAPHGTLKIRTQAFLGATTDVLMAEGALKRLLRERDHG